MDPGRDRLRAVDRRHHRPDRADARRRHHRCRPLGAAGREPCGRDHRRRARSDMRYGRSSRSWSAAATLHAIASCVLGPCDCRDQPRSGRTARDRRAARAQCPLCLARQRLGRRADGRLRLFSVEPLGVCRHLRCWRSRPCWRWSGSASAKSIVAQAHGAVVARGARCQYDQRAGVCCASVRC